jgi:hypothetical protein
MFFIVIPLKNSKIPSSKPFTSKEFQAQNLLPLKNFKLKTFYPWRIPSSKPITTEEFQALKNFNLKPLYPWRIPSSKPFTPEEFQGSSTGGGTDIKWNSPLYGGVFVSFCQPSVSPPPPRRAPLNVLYYPYIIPTILYNWLCGGECTKTVIIWKNR